MRGGINEWDDARPQPGLLPQEKENRSARQDSYQRQALPMVAHGY